MLNPAQIERVTCTLGEVLSTIKSLEEQLEVEKSTLVQQKEIIQSQNKRIADLETLVKQLRKRPSTEEDLSTVLTQLQEHITKLREGYERKKRKNKRDATPEPEKPEKSN